MKKLTLLKHLPLLCPGCRTDKYPSLGGSFCPECLDKLLFFDPALHCPGCGGENTGTLEFCHQCLNEPPRPWKDAVAVFAYRLTGETYYLDQFKEIDQWAWAHFKDPEYPEWFAYLNRRGEPTHMLKGGKWKTMFHLPRCLFVALDQMRRIRKNA